MDLQTYIVGSHRERGIKRRLKIFTWTETKPKSQRKCCYV
jgi:hypothetical protein